MGERFSVRKTRQQGPAQAAQSSASPSPQSSHHSPGKYNAASVQPLSLIVLRAGWQMGFLPSSNYYIGICFCHHFADSILPRYLIFIIPGEGQASNFIDCTLNIVSNKTISQQKPNCKIGWYQNITVLHQGGRAIKAPGC